jgi:signal transduction histidine kinase
VRSPERREGSSLTLSFRTRILFIVLALGTIPPLLLGLWLTRSGTRTSQALVVSQVEEVLQETVPTIISRWIGLRSQLLDLTDTPVVQTALGAPMAMGEGLGEAGMELDAGPEGVVSVRFQAVEGDPVSPSPLSLPEIPPMGTGPTILAELDVYSRIDGQYLGIMFAEIEPRSLLPESALMPSGGVFGLFDATTGESLLPRAFDRPLLADDRFVWGGEEWLARRSVLAEPGITVAVAAPLTPFIRPFEETAGQATLLLLTVAVLGLSVAVLVTRRLTRSMQALADAAEAVAGGDLERTIDVQGRDEVGRAARAFNAMTESLRRTLAELSSRESLAAMGEFAASLAHEVRNPLTAIRIDLERVEEGMPQDSELKMPQERALREIGRLEETVSRALSGVRGEIQPGLVDLRVALRAAAESAAPSFLDSQSELEPLNLPEPLEAQGDAGALEQLFLNLLTNAAQAMDPGGKAFVKTAVSVEGIQIDVVDEGRGIPEEILERVFEPLYTTRADGTGLGLTIARRIATAHGATLTLSPRPEGGTVATLLLPRRKELRL